MNWEVEIKVLSPKQVSGKGEIIKSKNLQFRTADRATFTYAPIPLYTIVPKMGSYR